eukprot:jgi/Mesen1/10739/ME000090S10199
MVPGDYCMVVKWLGQRGSWQRALELFEWLSLQRSYTQKYNEAAEIFREMTRRGCAPDLWTYNAMISVYARAGLEDCATDVLLTMQEKGFVPDAVSYNTVLSAFKRKGRMDEAHHLLAYMETIEHRPDEIMYNTVIDMYGKLGQPDRALQMFNDMAGRGCPPDSASYSSLISGLCRAGRVREAEGHLTLMKQQRLPPNLAIYAALLAAYARERNPVAAEDAFLDLQAQGLKADMEMYKLMMEVYQRSAMPQQARNVGAYMRSLGYAPPPPVIRSPPSPASVALPPRPAGSAQGHMSLSEKRMEEQMERDANEYGGEEGAYAFAATPPPPPAAAAAAGRTEPASATRGQPPGAAVPVVSPPTSAEKFSSGRAGPLEEAWDADTGPAGRWEPWDYDHLEADDDSIPRPAWGEEGSFQPAPAAPAAPAADASGTRWRWSRANASGGAGGGGAVAGGALRRPPTPESEPESGSEPAELKLADDKGAVTSSRGEEWDGEEGEEAPGSASGRSSLEEEEEEGVQRPRLSALGAADVALPPPASTPPGEGTSPVAAAVAVVAETRPGVPTEARSLQDHAHNGKGTGIGIGDSEGLRDNVGGAGLLAEEDERSVALLEACAAPPSPLHHHQQQQQEQQQQQLHFVTEDPSSPAQGAGAGEPASVEDGHGAQLLVAGGSTRPLEETVPSATSRAEPVEPTMQAPQALPGRTPEEEEGERSLPALLQLRKAPPRGAPGETGEAGESGEAASAGGTARALLGIPGQVAPGDDSVESGSGSLSSRGAADASEDEDSSSAEQAAGSRGPAASCDSSLGLEQPAGPLESVVEVPPHVASELPQERTTEHDVLEPEEPADGGWVIFSWDSEEEDEEEKNESRASSIAPDEDWEEELSTAESAASATPAAAALTAPEAAPAAASGGQGHCEDGEERLPASASATPLLLSLPMYERLIASHARAERLDDARALVARMQAAAIPLSAPVFASLISAYFRAAMDDPALATAQEMLTAGVRPPAETCEQVVTIHCRRGGLAAARDALHSLRAASCRTGNEGPPAGGGQEMTAAGEAAAGEAAAGQAAAGNSNVGRHLEGAYGVLIDAYGRAGEWRAAEALFQELQSEELLGPGVPAAAKVYMAMAAAYAQSGLQTLASDVLRTMRDKGIAPSLHAYNALLEGLVRSLRAARPWRSEKGAAAVPPGNNALAPAVAELEEPWAPSDVLPQMEALLQEMLYADVAPNKETLAAMLEAYAHQGRRVEALEQLAKMRAQAYVVPAASYRHLIGLLTRAALHVEADEMLTQMMEVGGYAPDIGVYNQMLAMYARVGVIARATDVFLAMIECGCAPNAASYQTLLSVYCKNMMVHEARWLMKARGVQATADVYLALADAYRQAGQVDRVEAVLADMRATGVEAGPWALNILMDAHGRAGDTEGALRVFESLQAQGVAPDVVQYTSLIDAHTKAGEYAAASAKLLEMKARSVEPNHVTWTCVLSAAARCSTRKDCLELLTGLRAIGFDLPLRLMMVGDEDTWAEARELIDCLGEAYQECGPGLANALIELFYCFEQRKTAARLFVMAVDRKLFPLYAAKVDEDAWEADLRSMSSGAALVGLHIWLALVQETALRGRQVVPKLAKLVTGSSKRDSRVTIKRTIRMHLWEMGSPFLPSRTREGTLTAKGHSLSLWVKDSPLLVDMEFRNAPKMPRENSMSVFQGALVRRDLVPILKELQSHGLSENLQAKVLSRVVRLPEAKREAWIAGELRTLPGRAARAEKRKLRRLISIKLASNGKRHF